MTGPGRRLNAPLTRLGFADGDAAAELLADPALRLWAAGSGGAVDDDAAAVIGAMAEVGDPQLAARSLIRLAEAAPDAGELRDLLRADTRFRARLLGVLGASTTLGDHLAANPEHWRVLSADRIPADFTGPLLEAVGADPADPPTGTGGSRAKDASPATVEALRLAYRRCLLSLAGRDLGDAAAVDEVAARLSDLAAATLTAALAIAAASLPADAPECRLAVIAMGKCGGRELNYVSDVDVIFVGEPAGGADEAVALGTLTRLASTLMTVCGDVAWQVDAALRPEGKQGQLVRTLASHEAYYRRWARTWEFQALLKARPVAGDVQLGARYVAALAPLVWTAADKPHFVEDVQAMRRRVERSLPGNLAERDLKLGPGGLRDVEFAVQLLALVHGRADDSLRAGSTLGALGALADGGYVGREDARTLAAAYRFLRTAEHRLQLQRMRRTHLLPDDPDGLRWLARGMGLVPAGRGDVVDAFRAQHARHAREVRRLHEKLFYRPLLTAVAKVPTEALRLTQDAALARLGALGFTDPRGALLHIAALTDGVSRRAAIQRALLPALLGAFADAPDPDAGLLGYRQVSEALQATPWYLRLLRDEGKVADRLAALLGSSRYVAELLARAPEALRLLADDAELQPRDAAGLRSAMQGAAARDRDAEHAVAAVRALRRHELLRTACANLLDRIDVAGAGRALSTVAAATVDAALATAWKAHDGPVRAHVSVVAMGRLGGLELGYGSDIDVLFCYVPADGADDREAGTAATAVIEHTRRLLSLPAPDPPLTVDADLRPEGRSGPLVRSLASFEAYYRRWSSVWEAQALLRAQPIAGDPDLGRRFVAMIDPIRYAEGGLDPAAVTEIRRIKARVDSERLPRGADPATHTKLGRGGLADVEWTVQLLQLQHAAEHPRLRTTSTLAALAGLRDLGLLAPGDTAALEAAWRLAMRARNAIMLVRGKAEDQLPRTGQQALSGVMRALGYPPERAQGEFLDDYLRTTRRARQVVERVFYE